MIKKPLLFIAIGLMLVSCGRGGWNCSKRYCDTSDETHKKRIASQKNINV